MTLVTGLTAVRMLAIEAASVVSGAISGDNLILTKHDGSTINAGNVRGPQGIPGTGVTDIPGDNRLLNGSFAVNQRQFTSVSLGFAFGHDRWQLNTIDNRATYSTQTATLGALPESAKNHARIVTSTQSTWDDRAILLQRIESVRSFSGKPVVISFWAKATSGTPKIAVSFEQNFGTGGSTSVSTYAGQVTLSTNWARYSITIAIPSISGKTVGTLNDDYLEVRLWTSAGSMYNAQTGTLGIQNNTFDIWGVQLQEGSLLTAFETLSYAKELYACQRYYYRLAAADSPSGMNVLSLGQAGSSGTIACAFQHPVPMRIGPTVVASATGVKAQTAPGIGEFAFDMYIVSASNTAPLRTRVYFSGTQPSGTLCQVYVNDGGYVEFKAEL